MKEITPALKYDFDRAMTFLEARLGDNEYLTGDMFTVADIILVHCCNWAQFGIKWELPGGKVGDYIARVRARPAFKKAMEIRNAG